MTVIRTAWAGEITSTITKYENRTEVGNFSQTRAIGLRWKSESKNKPRLLGITANAYQKTMDRKVQVEIADKPISEHLKELFESNVKGKSTTEQTRIKALPIKYTDGLPKIDKDLDHTHQVAHTISTGDAKPIKQPP